jgi:DNA-binding HxlR family transcriptional regulator
MFPATVQFLNERNLEYYDWSTSCGDGNGSVYYTAQQLCNNTMKHVGGQKTMVVLMHDSQPPAGKTGHDLIGGLPLIIKALYQKGYRFSEMHKDMPRVHQR